MLARNIAMLTSARAASHRPSLASDRTLLRLVAALVAARTALGMTQEEVAFAMSTTKSVVSRLEAASGRAAR